MNNANDLGAGCSAMSWTTRDGRHLWGRNFDFNRMAGESGVVYLPRGEELGGGWDVLRAVVTHPALADLPFILETPNELDGYAREIATMRGLADRAETRAAEGTR